jgi:hypothetical protein
MGWLMFAIGVGALVKGAAGAIIAALFFLPVVFGK